MNSTKISTRLLLNIEELTTDNRGVGNDVHVLLLYFLWEENNSRTVNNG